MPSHRLPDGSIPVLLSADSPALLRAEAAALLGYLAEHPAVAPGRVAEQLLRTRVARRYRALLAVTDGAELAAALTAVRDGVAHSAVVTATEPGVERSVAFVLPGQGTQRNGMGRVFYEGVEAYRSEADRCAALFEEQFGASPLPYLLGTGDEAEESAAVVQPALFTQMVALGALWRSFGVRPAATVGHSQGEIAAAYLSGVMSLADAVVVVGTRAHAVDKIASDRYAMAVVAADREECEDVIARLPGWAQVSVRNAPRMVGVSGERHTVQAVVEALAGRGRFARVIRVGYPAHTVLLNEFRDLIHDAVHSRLDSTRFLESEIPCIGSTLGAAVTPELPVDEYWFWNLRNPVRFDRAIGAAVAAGVDTFIELAEHPTLHLAIEENLAELPSTRTFGTSLRTATDLREFTRNLAELAVTDLGFSWDGLRTGDRTPPAPPLLDFPNVAMNELTLWLPHDTTIGRGRADRTDAPTVGRGQADGTDTPTVGRGQADGTDTPTVGRGQADRADAPTVALGQADRAGGHGEARTVVAAGPQPQLLVDNWVRLSRRSVTAPRRLGIVDHTGEQAALAAELSAYASRQGLDGRLLAPDTPADDIDTVVVLLPTRPAPDAATAVRELAAFLGERSWWTPPGAAIAEYWLITTDGEAVLPEDAPPHPVHAAASAAFRSAGAEYPGIAFRHLDLGAEHTAPAIVTALHTAAEPELALRDGNLYAKRLVEADPATLLAGPIRAADVLVTGGTGSLGLEFCEHAVRSGARRVTLLSRSGETSAVTARLRELRALGPAEIEVIACDIADPGAVAALGDRLARVGLLVHAAADNAAIGPGGLTDITPDQVERAMRGRVLGLEPVLERLAPECEIVLCSSLAATIGGRGTVLYAAANRLVDALAKRYRARGRHCVAVQWGQWAVFRGSGAAEPARLAEVGYLPMESADALALGLGGLRTDAAVAAFDWERGRNILAAFGYGPLLADLKTPVAPARRAPAAAPAEPAPVAGPTGDVAARVATLLAGIIGADDPGSIDGTRPLVAIGLDSLQALALRRQVASTFDADIPVSELIGGASLNDVVRLIGVPAAVPVAEANASVSAGPSGASVSPVPPHAPATPAPPHVPTPVASAAPPHAAPDTPALTPADRLARAKAAAQRVIPIDFDANTFRSARRDMDLFGLRAMLSTLRPHLSPTEPRTADDLADRLHFAPRHRWLLRQWLQALTTDGCLTGDRSTGYRYAREVAPPERPDLAQVCADLGYPRPLADFFQSSDDHLTELVQDTMRLQELLFPDGDTTTAEAAYRNNLSSRYLNLAAGRAVADLVTGSTRHHAPARVLELGAGIGGTTDEVAAALDGLPVEYHFTDVSDFFLTAAKHRFARYPWMRYALVDMNRDLTTLAPADIVIAANVLHNAHDIGVTLRHLHDLLRPGGALVVIETCHAHCEQLTSVHLLMSPQPGQPHAGLADVRAGTDRIFLTEDEWRAELRAAGLTPDLVLPQRDHPIAALDQRVFIAIRDIEPGRK
ncbi:nocobactin polyketide synthase NbtC [Nocardia sp. NPDC057227]|uniref:nocobactin polyketide synthase NbtC n=1 Tax=Nocardia sp. NPDC057227 TaxID=3346056 RepID=UPI00362DD74D